MKITIGIPIWRITLALIALILFLAVASYVTTTIVILEDIETGYFRGLRNAFAVGREANISTWYSSTQLLFSGLFLLLIAYHKRQISDVYARHWLLLGLMFFALSLDEAAELHEATIKPLRDLLGTGGFLYYAWIIPGAIAVAVVGALFLPFLRQLPPRIQRLFVVAAMVYVAGAIGMEAIGGQFYDAADFADDNLIRSHQDAMTYSTIVHIEETLEMLGIVILLYGLLTYLKLIDHPLFEFAES